MKTENLEKQLIQSTKGLSIDDLKEIIDFARFIRHKKTAKYPDNISRSLSLLNTDELHHLEDEFSDYQKKYPHE